MPATPDDRRSGLGWSPGRMMLPEIAADLRARRRLRPYAVDHRRALAAAAAAEPGRPDLIDLAEGALASGDPLDVEDIEDGLACLGDPDEP